MNPVYVDGIGLLSPRIRCVADLYDVLADCGGSGERTAWTEPFGFPLGVPASKVRRAPRYVKMAVAATAQAVADAEITEDAAYIGTIFSTGYGPVESNVTFADSVADGTPALASPTVFSYTVPNSCLGQVCIVNGFQGPSTLLIGGDPIEYAALLMAGGKARHILCGAVEEPTAALRESFRAAGGLSGDTLADSAAMLILSAAESERSYCRITQFSSVSLPAYPYVTEFTAAQEEEAVTAMTDALSACAAGIPPDRVLTIRSDSAFDICENAALSAALGERVPRIHPKEFFGEGLNAGYLESIALGAALLGGARRGGADHGLRTLLVTGLDVHGNYMAARMEV